MPRPAKVRWDDKRHAWVSAVGDISPTNGRRLPVPFRIGRDGRPLGPKDRPRAQQVLDDYLADRDTKTRVADGFNFGQLTQLYLAHSLRTAKPHTYNGHRKVLKLANDFRDKKGQRFGDRMPSALTTTHLDAIVQAWAAKNYKPTYIARMVGSVQAVLNWAAAPAPNREPERLIPSNPLVGYTSKHCRIPDAPDKYAPKGEIEAFVKWGRQRARGIGGLTGRFERLTIELVQAIAFTGVRPAELCVAEWRDFNPQAEKDRNGKWWGTITLDPERWKTGGKTQKKREVFLPPRLVRTIRAIDRLPDHHPTFIWTHRRGPRSAARGADVREHGEPWNSNALSRKIKELRRLAKADGVPVADEGDNKFVAYRLRHTVAANLLMAGHDVYMVGKLLGTSAAMIQKRYGSLLKGHMINAAADASGVRTGDPRRPSPPSGAPLGEVPEPQG